MKQRMQFIDEYLKREHSIAELCRRFGISRKTGHKWVARFREEGGEEGLVVTLADRSRRPHSSPTATDEWLAEAIVAARKQRPNWGPKKLRAALGRNNPTVALPSESTFARLFKANGLVRPRRRRNRTPPYSAPLAHASVVNRVWCIDFKGQFRVGQTTCYPLTVTDACSRYLIACVALTSTQAAPTKRALQRVFDEFGLPDAIRSDNGTPFASRGVAGLTTLSAWWLKLGIQHERIERGKPQQNGRHERMHLTLKQETTSPPARSLLEQQRRFDRFRKYFNEERPHEALGQRPPSEVYEPSRRRLPIPPWGRDFVYPTTYEVVRVSKTGLVRSRAGNFDLTAALRSELVGLGWTDGVTADVYFGKVCLGTLRRDRTTKRLAFRAVEKVLPMSWHKVSPMSSQ